MTTDASTALDRAKAAIDTVSFASRMRAAGYADDSEAVRIAKAADLQNSCLRTQLEAKGVQLDIAHRAAARGNR